MESGPRAIQYVFWVHDWSIHSLHDEPIYFRFFGFSQVSVICFLWRIDPYRQNGTPLCHFDSYYGVALPAVPTAVCVSTGLYALLGGDREAKKPRDSGVDLCAVKISARRLRGGGLRRSLCVIAELLAHTALTGCVGLSSTALLLQGSPCLVLGSLRYVLCVEWRYLYLKASYLLLGCRVSAYYGCSEVWAVLVRC